ncbi:MAG: hypothetical protein BAJALOKI1v1_670011 [Promethearchaeota archaeon]|nr:MAG: hypothetical protein BAJALOKI1v1_670011 [Candidatus Lokiarchaeota archaeon]
MIKRIPLRAIRNENIVKKNFKSIKINTSKIMINVAYMSADRKNSNFFILKIVKEKFQHTISRRAEIN